LPRDDNLERGHARAVRWQPLVRHSLHLGKSLRATLSRYDIAAVLHCGAYAYIGASMQAPGFRGR
jgi:UDP-glucose 4-epimerase